eukprot:1348353-Rhodomonas_salina.1
MCIRDSPLPLSLSLPPSLQTCLHALQPLPSSPPILLLPILFEGAGDGFENDGREVSERVLIILEETVKFLGGTVKIHEGKTVAETVFV